MRIIDLLNKIANGEEVPKKIMFRRNVYVWIERNDNIFNYKREYNGKLIDNYFCDDWFVDSNDILNDEVEIIEEDKKIEKIDLDDLLGIGYYEGKQTLAGKINEIIDHINKEEK